ncbi:MAG: TIGR02147 family protein [Chitinispirillaceae bacterium]|nr:TIGR02147 family protein [Chitinispirillaceae bacterium]
MKSKPNIFELIDYRKYLTAWRENEKENNPGLTHEYLCVKLGQKNRAYFSDLEKGRRTIGQEVLDRLIKLMALSADEAKYFRAMVGYGQSTTFEEREFWFEQAIQLNNTPRKIVDRKTYAYYKKWYHTTIRAYLETCNFKNEYAEASSKLYGRVSPKEVKVAIKNLLALGLIAPNREGYLKPADKVLTTGEAVRDELVQCYNLSNIDLLRTIVAQNRPETYESRHLTVSVSSRAMERIRKRIEQLRSEITSIVHKDENKADRVYKIAIHTFPESTKD